MYVHCHDDSRCQPKIHPEYCQKDNHLYFQFLAHPLCAHSVKGCEVGTDVACIKDIKLSSNTCNSTFLDR